MGFILPQFLGEYFIAFFNFDVLVLAPSGRGYFSVVWRVLTQELFALCYETLRKSFKYTERGKQPQNEMQWIFWGVKKGRKCMCLCEPKVKIDYRCSTVCVCVKEKERGEMGRTIIYFLLVFGCSRSLSLHVGCPLAVESGASRV